MRSPTGILLRTDAVAGSGICEVGRGGFAKDGRLEGAGRGGGVGVGRGEGVGLGFCNEAAETDCGLEGKGGPLDLLLGYT
jgi:hypothetical protein